MQDDQLPSVLAVACAAPTDEDLIGGGHATSVGSAEDGRRALELMQLLRYDLIVVGAGMSDMTVWTLVQRMRVLAPWQKWVLVGSGESGADESGAGISTDSEIAARALGAIAVMDDPGDWQDICQLAQTVAKKSRRALVMAG